MGLKKQKTVKLRDINPAYPDVEVPSQLYAAIAGFEFGSEKLTLRVQGWDSKEARVTSGQSQYQDQLSTGDAEVPPEIDPDTGEVLDPGKPAIPNRAELFALPLDARVMAILRKAATIGDLSDAVRTQTYLFYRGSRPEWKDAVEE